MCLYYCWLLVPNMEKNVLSEKIAKLLTTTPNDEQYDDELADDTNAKCTDKCDSGSEEDFISEDRSKFRTANVHLLQDVDEKYRGEGVSRKRLRSNSNSSTSDDINSAIDSEECHSVDDDLEYESHNESKDNDVERSHIDEPEFIHLPQEDEGHAKQKGISVRNQILKWENLLEMRIQLQQLLLNANKMPQQPCYSDLQQDCEYETKLQTAQMSVKDLLMKLMELHNLILKTYPETNTLLDNISENKSTPTDYGALAEEQFKTYTPYRNEIIQKWDEKTSISNLKRSHSILQQIDYVLADRDRLVKRTRTKRSDFQVVGLDRNVEIGGNDVEIFDDVDFYHQQLRELIETKSSNVSDPIQLSRQWIQLQQLRKKVKRTIDTRATKGRKIRYTVHQKLVNFMAPMVSNTSWSDEAKNELYSSLFGKKTT